MKNVNSRQTGKVQDMAILLAQFIDTSRGTLWWVREDLVKQTHLETEREYNQNSDRQGHPGLSLSPKSILHMGDPCFMLQGFTKPISSSFVVQGLTRKEPSRITYFTLLFPLPISGFEFVKPAKDADPDTVEGKEFDRYRVFRNSDKPKLNEVEMEQLENWLKQKGLSHE